MAFSDWGHTQPAQLAARTGTTERYVREWLNAQAAAGYDTNDKRTKEYTLPPAQAEQKLTSIQAHNIPVVGMPQHQAEMESFVKSEEVFWTPLAGSR